MILEEFQAELELDRTWREEDIRFLHNLQARLPNVDDKERFRRSIVGMFYAHIEGYVYFSFNLYASSINELNLKCRDVKPVLMAATLSKEFEALKNPDKKNPLFKREFPEDKKLHQTCRQIDFLEQLAVIQDRDVKIPRDYINTENNVGPDVLRKLLYQMGLEHNDLDSIKVSLHKLLNIRNDIAHGKYKDGIPDADYESFKECFNTIFTRISNLLMNSLSNEDFRLVV